MSGGGYFVIQCFVCRCWGLMVSPDDSEENELRVRRSWPATSCLARRGHTPDLYCRFFPMHRLMPTTNKEMDIGRKYICESDSCQLSDE